jgi:hypothetical protein
MSSPLEPTSPRVCAGLRSPSPEMMSPAERLEEAASLLARGILRRRLRAAYSSAIAFDSRREKACPERLRQGPLIFPQSAACASAGLLWTPVARCTAPERRLAVSRFFRRARTGFGSSHNPRTPIT